MRSWLMWCGYGRMSRISLLLAVILILISVTGESLLTCQPPHIDGEFNEADASICPISDANHQMQTTRMEDARIDDPLILDGNAITPITPLPPSTITSMTELELEFNQIRTSHSAPNPAADDIQELPIDFSRLPPIHPVAYSSYFDEFPIVWTMGQTFGPIWYRHSWTLRPNQPYTMCDIEPEWQYLLHELFDTNVQFGLYSDVPHLRGELLKNKAPCFLFEKTAFNLLVEAAERHQLKNSDEQEQQQVRIDVTKPNTTRDEVPFLQTCHFPSQRASHACSILNMRSLELLRLLPNMHFYPLMGFHVTPRILKILDYYRRPNNVWAIGFTGEPQSFYPWAWDANFRSLVNFTWGDRSDHFQVPFLAWVKDYAEDLLAVPMMPVPGFQERKWLTQKELLKLMLQRQARKRLPTAINGDLDDSGSISTKAATSADSTAAADDEIDTIPTAPMMAAVSNCGRQHRTDLLGRLMKYMPIDSYGLCLKNRPWPKFKDLPNEFSQHSKEGFTQKQRVLNRYLFSFSVENAYESSYVTEKLWQSLVTGSIPVYLGPSNIASMLPCNNCIIDLRDYGPLENEANLQQLARDLLAIASNESEWLKYQEWRLEPRNELWRQRVEQQQKYFKHPECAICALKHTGEIPEEVKLLRELTLAGEKERPINLNQHS